MLPAPPEGRRRRAASAFIAAVALASIAVPLRYYLGSDTHDERFSWRMFSAVRMQKCKTEYHEAIGGTSRPVKLESILDATWIDAFSRRRERATWLFLERRCALPALALTSARITLRCVKPSGEHMPDAVWQRECQTGKETRQ